MKISKTHIELLIYQILSMFVVNWIGSISFGDLMIIFITPLIFSKNIFTKYPILKSIRLIYFFLFLSQVLSEVVIRNEFSNTIKGLATTIISFLTVIYLFDRLKGDLRLIVYMFFINFIIGVVFFNITENSSTDFLSNMQEAGFFKIKIIPLLTSFAMFYSYYLLKKKNKKKTYTLFFIFGIVSILGGARSASLIFFLTGLFLLFGQHLISKTIPKKYIIVITAALLYCLYIIWVENIDAINKNSEIQISKLGNKYNPLELLLVGRGSVLIGLQAFEDEWLWGHGAWAKDFDMKYTKMMVQQSLGYVPKNFGQTNDGMFLIPSHSVIIGAGVQNGIFALISVLALVYFFLKQGFNQIPYIIGTPLIAILINTLVQVIWHVLFSPTGHLRQTLPFSFAIILLCYNYSEFGKKYETENKNIT